MVCKLAEKMAERISATFGQENYTKIEREKHSKTNELYIRL